MGERQEVRGADTYVIDTDTGKTIRKYRRQAAAGKTREEKAVSAEQAKARSRKRILCDWAATIRYSMSHDRMLVVRVRNNVMHQGTVRRTGTVKRPSNYQGSNLTVELEGGEKFELDDVVELDRI